MFALRPRSKWQVSRKVACRRPGQQDQNCIIPWTGPPAQKGMFTHVCIAPTLKMASSAQVCLPSAGPQAPNGMFGPLSKSLAWLWPSHKPQMACSRIFALRPVLKWQVPHKNGMFAHGCTAPALKWPTLCKLACLGPGRMPKKACPRMFAFRPSQNGKLRASLLVYIAPVSKWQVPRKLACIGTGHKPKMQLSRMFAPRNGQCRASLLALGRAANPRWHVRALLHCARSQNGQFSASLIAPIKRSCKGTVANAAKAYVRRSKAYEYPGCPFHDGQDADNPTPT